MITQKQLTLFVRHLKECRPYLSKRQYLVLKGQAISGDIDGASKGLAAILSRRDKHHAD